MLLVPFLMKEALKPKSEDSNKKGTEEAAKEKCFSFQEETSVGMVVNHKAQTANVLLKASYSLLKV